MGVPQPHGKLHCTEMKEKLVSHPFAYHTHKDSHASSHVPHAVARMCWGYYHPDPAFD